MAKQSATTQQHASVSGLTDDAPDALGGGQAAIADDAALDAGNEFNPLDLPDLSPRGSAGGQGNTLDLLGDVELDVTVELGRTEMLVEDVLRLSEGSVVELDKLAGDPVDVYVNHRLVARGEVLVLNDNFCIRISEIVDDLEEQAQEAAAQIAAG